MLRSLVFIVAALGCVSCQLRKNNESVLQAKIDSLQNIVNQNAVVAQTLQEVSAMIDSIDVSRKAIGKNISNNKKSYDELLSRMKEISAFVKHSQEKIAELDAKILKSGNSYEQYAATIKNLEASLELKNRELSDIQKHAEQFSNQNQNLIHLVDLQKSEIDDKLVQLQTKQDELIRLQSGVDRLLASSVEEKAQNCYIRAQILEETANRTKLAPHKKRNTRLEALELYKMASFYGKDEANEKITALEKKI